MVRVYVDGDEKGRVEKCLQKSGSWSMRIWCQNEEQNRMQLHLPDNQWFGYSSSSSPVCVDLLHHHQ